MDHPHNLLDLLDDLAEDLITDQISAYQALQKQLETLTDPDPGLPSELEDLCYTLAAADQAAQETYAYQKAGILFLRAFRVDPHNQQLYWLAELMRTLAQASTESPDRWLAACDQLAQQETYTFKAAAYYLTKAKTRVADEVSKVIHLIRTGLLEASRTTLQEIEQTWVQLPVATQCLQHICHSYWQLYDYSKQDADINQRLHTVSASLNQAQMIYEQISGRAIPDPALEGRHILTQKQAANGLSLDEPESRVSGVQVLGDELKILQTLAQIYQALYQNSLYEFETFKDQLQELPDYEGHVFIKRQIRELNSLNNWKYHHQTVYNYCLNHQYREAVDYLQQLTDVDKEAIKWLNSAATPDLRDWETFCGYAQAGLEAWQAPDYQQAQIQFSSALNGVPIYLDGEAPATLHQEFEEMVQDLTALQLALTDSLNTLNQAHNFEEYKPILALLQPAQEIEERHRPILGGAPYIAELVDRAAKFVEAARQGNLEPLQEIIARSEVVADPLLPGYERITEQIRQGRGPDAWLGDIEVALKLAPDCLILRKQREEISGVIQASDDILVDIQQARFNVAWDKLEAWEKRQAVLPSAINCLWHLCASYDHLIGPLGQTASAKERLNHATQSLAEAKRTGENHPSGKLNQELNTLTALIEIYHRLNQRGLAALHAVETELNELQDNPNLPRRHAARQIFVTNVANLARWQKRRQQAFDALTQHQYPQALEILSQLSAAEKQTLAWLEATSEPDWDAWEAFCLQAQHTITLWQAHNYREAQTNLAYAAQKIPPDLSPAQRQILQEQFEKMEKDLGVIEGGLHNIRQVLEKATEAQIYEQVANDLEAIRKIESDYFRWLSVEQSPVKLIINRYNQFTAEARQGNAYDLYNLITEGIKANDPLVPGYETVRMIIETGKKIDASRQQVQAAWQLAPESEEFAHKIELFETDEIAHQVLRAIRRGDMVQTESLLDILKERWPGTPRVECLVAIYTGYQALYSPASSSQAVSERLSKARQVISEVKTCYGAELTQEQDTLKTLIRTYSNFHPARWADLTPVAPPTTAISGNDESTTTVHVFISRLNEEIKGLAAWKERRQRILDHWQTHQYIKAWTEFEQVTPAEKEALAWVEENTQAGWKSWRNFCEAASFGLEDWQQHNYENAQKWLKVAVSRIPTDFEQSRQETLATYLNRLVNDLNTLQQRFNQAQDYLRQLDANYYDQVTAELKRAQDIEKTYDKFSETDNTYVKRIIKRYDEFKHHVLVGDTDQLSRIFQASISDGDPLSESYARIRDIVSTAQQPAATHKQILEALQVAPQDAKLLEQHKYFERRRKIVPRILLVLAVVIISVIVIASLVYLGYLDESLLKLLYER